MSTNSDRPESDNKKHKPEHSDSSHARHEAYHDHKAHQQSMGDRHGHQGDKHLHHVSIHDHHSGHHISHIHRVKKGETVWGIAHHELNKHGHQPHRKEINKFTRQIMRANHIENPKHLKPGTELMIPEHGKHYGRKGDHRQHHGQENHGKYQPKHPEHHKNKKHPHEGQPAAAPHHEKPHHHSSERRQSAPRQEGPQRRRGGRAPAGDGGAPEREPQEAPGVRPAQRPQDLPQVSTTLPDRIPGENIPPEQAPQPQTRPDFHPSEQQPGSNSARYSINNGELQLNLSTAEKMQIGNRIRMNESGTTAADGGKGLTEWNSGEQFPSLGIAHTIWQPQGSGSPFGDSFRPMIKYMEDHHVQGIPSWLNSETPSPWATRSQFMADYNSPKMTELRRFLANTVPQQTDYTLSRLEGSYSKILEATSPEKRQQVQNNFARMLNSGPAGVFAMTDYVNFKGEGFHTLSDDNRPNWGLRQVLENMRNTGNPTVDFAQSADMMLRKRVENASPGGRAQEAKWLPGWEKRIAGYVDNSAVPQQAPRYAPQQQAPMRPEQPYVTMPNGERVPVNASPRRSRESVPPGVPADRVPPRPDASDRPSMAPGTGPLSGRTFVIDPGHGLQDTGAQSFGQNEKDLVLPYAALLGRKLHDMGANVVYTRPVDRDGFTTWDQRTQIANQAHPDAVIRIHANYDPNHRATGMQSYWMDQKDRGLAEALQGSILQAEHGQIGNAGVHHKDFHVHPNAPSALIELGFMTDKNELTKLMSPAYRSAAVDGMVNGLVRYVQSRG